MATIRISDQKIKGQWETANLFVPDSLRQEWLVHPLAHVVPVLADSMPDQLFFLSSVVSSWNGRPRKKGSSHIEGHSIDLAPCASKRQVEKDDGTAPNLCDNLRLATFLAILAQARSIAVVLEDDHFHLDNRLQTGCYLLQSRHSVYAKAWAEDPRTAKVYSVSPLGETRLTTVPFK